MAAEHLCRAYAEEFQLPLVILRYFSVYGPRQRPDMGYYRFIHALLRSQQVTVYGDGLQIRGNTYIDDCVEATLAAREAPVGEVFNVGGGETANVWEILGKLEAILGCRAIVQASRRAPAINASPAPIRPGCHAIWAGVLALVSTKDLPFKPPGRKAYD